MTEYTKRAIVCYCIGISVLILSTYSIINLLKGLNSYDKNIQMIIDNNEIVPAKLIHVRSVSKVWTNRYFFETENGKIYTSYIGIIYIKKNLIPKIGEIKGILIHPNLNICIIKKIKDEQIFSYRVTEFTMLGFFILTAILGIFILVVTILANLGVMKWD